MTVEMFQQYCAVAVAIEVVVVAAAAASAAVVLMTFFVLLFHQVTRRHEKLSLHLVT